MFTGPKLYDPKKYTITWGSHVFAGFANGSFLRVSRASDAMTKYVGSDGTVSRARNADLSGEFALTLAQTSPSHDYCSRKAKDDEDLGTGIFPMMVKDMLGTTVAVGHNTWIRKMAELELAAEVGAFEWIFDCDRLDFFLGGAR